MHDTAMFAAEGLAKTYGGPGKIVVDIGGLNVNGSARPYFENAGMKYICVDMEVHPSVDIVVKPGEELPFETGSVDIIISISCFEHDPMFWVTFLEMCRVIKKDTGIIYIDAPAQGNYHRHPGDNWRFYQDAAQALSYWSGFKTNQYPVTILETFHIYPIRDIWIDFIGIWKRTDTPEKSIVLTNDQKNYVGVLQSYLRQEKKISTGHYDGKK